MMFAALAVMAVMAGALGGAVVWWFRIGIAWGGLLTAGGFLAWTVLLESYSLKGAVSLGFPLATLTFLAAWLVAGALEARTKWRRIWTALAASGSALLAGMLCMLTARIHLWAPVLVALPVDVCLVWLVFLGRKAGGRKVTGSPACQSVAESSQGSSAMGDSE